MLSKFKTALTLITAWPLYMLSYLCPRDHRLWVFIGWHGRDGKGIFADNTKYLFLHTSNTYPALQTVWLAEDEDLAKRLRLKGYRAYHHTSLKGIWTSIRAGTTIIDAFLQPETFRWTGGTRLVQLLHGRGMKKKGYNVPPPRKHDYIFCPSPFIEKLLSPVFTKKAKIFHTGYPRNDIFAHNIKGSEIDVDLTLQQLLTTDSYTKKILYAPTYRRGQSTLPLSQILDLTKLTSWLAEKNYLLVITLHPKYLAQERLQSGAGLYFCPPSDLYPLLEHFDILINDYSSLIYDFLLLDKPIIFFPYDLEEYTTREGLAFPYETYTPGPKAYDTDGLISALEATVVQDVYGAKRKQVRDTYFVHSDGHASERIVQALLEEKV